MLGGMRRRMDPMPGIGGFTIAQEPFDPSTMNDPVASKTAWTPSKMGGANFGTYRLVQVDPTQLEFRTTIAARLVFGAFGLVGFVQIAVATWFIVLGGDRPDADLSIGGMRSVTFGFIFMISGLVMIAGTRLLFRFFLPPVVFDQRRGEYWKGKSPPAGVRGSGTRTPGRLADIHALQLVRGYRSFELNVVSADGSRSNVVNHGDGTSLRADAERLAAFLGKPLWDAVG